MIFKVTFNESTRIVESRVHDNFDWDLIETMVPEIAKLVIKMKSNLIFIDFRNCKVNMSTMKIYETPREIAEVFAKNGVNASRLKRAILINTAQNDFDFLENVTSSNAQVLKLFHDEEAAMTWLSTLESPDNNK